MTVSKQLPGHCFTSTWNDFASVEGPIPCAKHAPKNTEVYSENHYASCHWLIARGCVGERWYWKYIPVLFSCQFRPSPVSSPNCITQLFYALLSLCLSVSSSYVLCLFCHAFFLPYLWPRHHQSFCLILSFCSLFATCQPVRGVPAWTLILFLDFWITSLPGFRISPPCSHFGFHFLWSAFCSTSELFLHDLF